MLTAAIKCRNSAVRDRRWIISRLFLFGASEINCLLATGEQTHSSPSLLAKSTIFYCVYRLKDSYILRFVDKRNTTSNLAALCGARTGTQIVVTELLSKDV